MKKLISHNRGAFTSMLLTTLWSIWIFGCQSTTSSPITQNKSTRAVIMAEEKVFAEEHNAESRTMQIKFEAAYADLDKQDATKQALYELVAPAVQSALAPYAGGALLLGLGGIVFDNRRKDKIIKNGIK